MKRSLFWLVAMLTLLAGCTYITVQAPPTLSQPEVQSIAHPGGSPAQGLVLGASLGTDPTVWYSNERAQGRMWVTDPVFAGGAKGDDTTDDTAAIVAANAKAKAVLGNVMFPPPSVAWKTTSEIPVQWAAKWHCDAANLNQNVIRAHAAMRSVLYWQSAYCPTCAGHEIQPETGGAAKSILDGCTIDANFQAANALLNSGSNYGTFHNDHFINAAGVCYRNAQIQNAVSLGAVVPSVGGGSPSGVTVAQADANYFISPLSGTTGTLVIKVASTGTLTNATYVFSRDGGSTYTSGPLPISATTNIATNDLTGGLGKLTGMVATFPAGTYHAGDTYSVPVTWTLGIADTVLGFNGDQEVDHSQFSICGTTTSTSAFAGDFSAYHGSVSASGTAATAAGSPIITGTGTTWSSIPNAGWSIATIKVSASPTPLVFEGQILDDTHFAVFHGVEPSATASGLAWAIATGGGLHEQSEGEGQWTHVHDTAFDLCSQGIWFASDQGPLAEKINMVSSALAGGIFGGGTDNSVNNAHATNWHCNSGSSINGGVCFYIGPGTTGFIEEPQSVFTLAGTGAGGWILRELGVETPITAGGAFSYLPLQNAQLRQTPVTISGAGQTIPCPDPSFFQNNGHSSFIAMSLTSSFTFVSTPTIAGCPAGTVLEILNNSLGGQVATFQPQAFTSSGLNIPGRTIVQGPGDVTMWRSLGPSIWPSWTFMGIAHYYGSSPVGNMGTGTFRVVTNSATPAAAYQLAVQAASGIAPTGTDVTCDVAASDGPDIANWSGARFSWTNTGTRVLANEGTVSGSGAGNSPPFGWAISADANVVGAANLFVAGDASHTVTWTGRCQHMDHGQ